MVSSSDPRSLETIIAGFVDDPTLQVRPLLQRYRSAYGASWPARLAHDFRSNGMLTSTHRQLARQLLEALDDAEQPALEPLVPAGG